jgi:hypothetical protein
MECVLKILHLLAEIAAPCVKAFREGSEKVRDLECRAETAEKKCSELEQKNRASESEIQSLRQQVATERAGKHFVGVVLVLVMFFYHISPFLVGLVLGILNGSLLLRLSTRVGQWAGNFIRQVPPGLDRLFDQIRQAMPHLVEQIRSRIRNWKCKPINVSRSFGTTH